MKENAFDAVIVAGGDYPTALQALEILESAPFVVCCDGAADRYIATGRVPDAIVGDGDSISPENREKHAHLLHIIPSALPSICPANYFLPPLPLQDILHLPLQT